MSANQQSFHSEKLKLIIIGEFAWVLQLPGFLNNLFFATWDFFELISEFACDHLPLTRLVVLVMAYLLYLLCYNATLHYRHSKSRRKRNRIMTCTRGRSSKVSIFKLSEHEGVKYTTQTAALKRQSPPSCQTVWGSNLFNHRSCMLKRRLEKPLQNTSVLTSD